jgi:hypothetical protein
MPFRSGSVTYARFRVVGSGSLQPLREIDQPLLDALAARVLKPSEIGEPPAMEFGWCGGRHVYDDSFDPSHVAFGSSLLFGLRVDTNKVPSDILRAYRALAESVYEADSSTGFISRRERQAAREEAEDRCRRELASGRFRRSKMIDVVWDLPRGVLLAPATGDDVIAGLRSLFEETFDLTLRPLSAGALAHDEAAATGRARDVEDARPSIFTPAPPGSRDSADGEGDSASSPDRPNPPWTQASPEPADFLGNEFLLWLMERTERRSAGDVDVEAADLAIDRALDLECAWDATGKASLHMSAPARAREAVAALQRGKWPRKAGLLLAVEQEPFEFILQADRFVISGLKIARPEEDVASPRELVEHRLAAVRALDESITARYREFLQERLGAKWSAGRERIAAWIRTGVPAWRPRGMAHGAEVMIEPRVNALTDRRGLVTN